jgi:hypothetical protein
MNMDMGTDTDMDTDTKKSILKFVILSSIVPIVEIIELYLPAMDMLLEY